MKKIVLINILSLVLFNLSAQSNLDNLFTQQDSIIASLKKSYSLSEYDKPSIIMKFNKDTIIIAGYLSKEVHDSRKNIIYKTINGGVNWRQIVFSGDAWIYDSYYDINGNIWIGGSDNYIHYSDNFGETWTKLIKPFNPVNRVLSIYMIDSKNGISGGLHNGLALTNDNWETSIQIQTPLDQGKFTITENSSRNRIDKVEILNKFVIINQNDHIYYSNIANINWKEFTIPVRTFEVKKEKNELHLASLKGKWFVLNNNLELVNSYIETFSFFEENNTTNSFITSSDFFKHNINSIKIKSVKYDIAGMTNTSFRIPIYEENVQTAKFIQVDSLFRFKSKGYSKKESINYTFSKKSLLKIFNNSSLNYPLENISKSLIFEQLDFTNYNEFLTEEITKRNEEKIWGGDFTYLIDINNNSFQDYENITKNANQSLISPTFKETFNVYPFQPRYSPYFELSIVNEQNDTLWISNENSIQYSLPWKIKIRDIETFSYNPEITRFIRSVIPNDFNNYEYFLAGKLIYLIIKEKNIQEIEY